MKHETLASFVPRRAMPPEVLELPDADGYWWHRDNENCKWQLDEFEVSHGRVWWSHSGAAVRPRQYVRCVPPIVTPEPKDADAEWLRAIFVPAARWSIEDMSRASRIADRLESGKERT